MALLRDIKYIETPCILMSKAGGPIHDIDVDAYIIPVHWGGDSGVFEKKLLALIKEHLNYDFDDIRRV